MGSCSLLSTSERRAVRDYTVFASLGFHRQWEIRLFAMKKQWVLSRDGHTLVLSQAWSASACSMIGKGQEISKPARGRDQATKASCNLPELGCVIWRLWQYLRFPLVARNSQGTFPASPVAGSILDKLPSLWVISHQKAICKADGGKLWVPNVDGELWWVLSQALVALPSM